MARSSGSISSRSWAVRHRSSSSRSATVCSKLTRLPLWVAISSTRSSAKSSSSSSPSGTWLSKNEIRACDAGSMSAQSM